MVGGELRSTHGRTILHGWPNISLFNQEWIVDFVSEGRFSVDLGALAVRWLIFRQESSAPLTFLAPRLETRRGHECDCGVRGGSVDGWGSDVNCR